LAIGFGIGFTEMLRGVRKAFEILFEFRGKVNDCEYSVVFLDFMDFVKSVCFQNKELILMWWKKL